MGKKNFLCMTYSDFLEFVAAGFKLNLAPVQLFIDSY